MKTRTKVSIAIPFLMMAVMLTANVAAAPQNKTSTTTPIQHVVVIFQENISFDHYFGTYPNAANLPNEPQFAAAPGTPSVNGLTGGLLTNNPNGVNPFRLDRTQAVTCDNNHDYSAEQQAFNGGLMNKFTLVGCTGAGSPPNVVMGYYDGNTVTGLWNYAQNFALNDNFFGTTFGPSTPGALNLISGMTGPMSPAGIPGTTASNGIVIGDPDPTYDDCSGSTVVGTATGTNVGNALNSAGLTWGWFQGGFAPTVPYNPLTSAKAVCGSSHYQVAGTKETDYSPHHEPFQYFASTANPHHLPPTSPSMIGYTDQANHQYDLSSFWVAADSGNLPAVSFLKADRYQDGHPGNSDPLDEQTFLANTINQLMQLPSWSSTAVFITWDDSDGWYDHAMGPIVSQSSDPVNDALGGSTGLCGTTPAAAYSDRCGYGPRIPVLAISPYAKQNFVDNTLTDQTSILKFIKDNWNIGTMGPGSFDNIAGTLDNMFDFRHPQPGDGQVFLNPSTGEITHGHDQTSICTDQTVNPDVCATQSNFNNNAMGTGNYVWFNSVAHLQSDVPSIGLTIHFSGLWIQLQLKDGTTLTLPAPNAEIIYSTTATTSTTAFTGGQWVTTVPTSYKGDVFLAGLAYQVPAGVSLPGAKVTWTGAFSGTTNSFNLKWQWGAAAYTGFGTLSLSNANALYNGLGIKPIDSSTGSAYLNNDNSGTPENFKANVIGGATGNGGNNWTGNYGPMGSASYQAYLLNQ